MRYAPSDRFWRNVLLTIALCVCTLGFSVANWNGSGLQLAEHRDPQSIEARASKAPPAADLLTARSEYAGGGSAKLEGLGEAVTSADGDVPTTGSFSGQSAAGGAGARDFTAPRRSGYSRRNSSSGDNGPGSLSAAGRGVGGGVWGTGRSDKRAELIAKAGKPKLTSRSGSTGSKSGSSTKSKRDKSGKDSKSTTDVAENAPPVGTPSGYDGSTGSPSGSPASTPEPLSMILVGTGLAGLYRARKYLS